jgi:hypothetical protein
MQGRAECGLESVKAHGQVLDQNAKTCVKKIIKIFLQHEDKICFWGVLKNGRPTLNHFF